MTYFRLVRKFYRGPFSELAGLPLGSAIIYLFPMTYDQAIAYWFGRINFETRSATPKDLKLERMRALLARLGNPQDRLRIVHITGTKGKGSTAAMVDAILRANGYRVGLFTSPHLVRVEERIQVNGVPISAAELASGIAQIAEAARQLEAENYPPITFFEIGTALGHLHFLKRRVDFAVVEVGLGGRFDSTNVCRPVVSVITSIGFDHTAQLGNTLEAIAYQKAGILKQKVPAVSGVGESGPREVIRQVANQLSCPLLEVNTDFESAYTPPTVEWPFPQATIRVRNQRWSRLQLGLYGRHQAANAAVALAAIDRLSDQGVPITSDSIAHGIASVRWPGRVELLPTGPEMPIRVIDAAHNPPSIAALLETLAEIGTANSQPIHQRHLVFAVSNDKPYADMLAQLLPAFDQFHLCSYGNNPRAVPPDRLRDLVGELAPDKPAHTYPDSASAWQAAIEAAGANGLVCAAGSVFLAGEIRAIATAETVLT